MADKICMLGLMLSSSFDERSSLWWWVFSIYKVTCDTWCVTCDTWHLKHAMWHLCHIVYTAETPCNQEKALKWSKYEAETFPPCLPAKIHMIVMFQLPRSACFRLREFQSIQLPLLVWYFLSCVNFTTEGTIWNHYGLAALQGEKKCNSIRIT